MRIRNPNGINISEHVVGVDKDGHAEPIDFGEEDADIIVLSYQPGIGKTYSVLQYMKEHENSFYFTDRHNVINEHLKDWDKQDYSHWIGFSKQCKNNEMKSLNEKYLISPSVICKYCSRQCRYKAQFTQRKRVFAPFQYLPTAHVMSKLPNIVFIDENKGMVDSCSFNAEETISWLDAISRYSDMPGEYQEFMNEGNYSFFLYGGIQDIQSSYYREAQDSAFRENRLQDLKTITKINPYHLERYLYFAETYNDFERDAYYIPYWYYPFEIANKGVKVVFLDASFNKEWFWYMLQCFNGEIGFDNDISVQIYSTKEQNRNTIVYNMRHSETRGGWYPKQSFQQPSKSMWQWLPVHLRKIRDIFGRDNIGIITFKEIADSKYISLLGYDIGYFGSLRSSNLLRDKRVLVVLGTYHGTKAQVFEHLEKIFDIHDRDWILEEETLMADEGLQEFFEGQLVARGIMASKHKRRFIDAGNLGFLNENNRVPEKMIMPVFWMQKSIWEDEMYQAFHRNRGLQKDRIVFAYCWFPVNIVEEFSIESVGRDKKSEAEFWDKLEQKERKKRLMVSLIEDIGEGNKKTVLSEKYRMWGKTNRDLIEEYISKYEEIQKKIKEPLK